MIGDVHENGSIEKRLLSEQTLAKATKNITPNGELDRYAPHMPTKFAQGGFQLYGQDFDVFGEGVFGHAGKIFVKTNRRINLFDIYVGFGGSCGFAYPQKQIAYAYVCNFLNPMSSTIDLRTARIVQTIEQIIGKHFSSTLY